MFELLPPSLQRVIARTQAEFGELDPSVRAIVTGHLLVEEMLTGVLEHLVHDKGALARANLRFYQRASLVRSLWPSETDYDVRSWALIEKLNELRNALAHSLDREKRSRKTSEFLDQYRQIEKSPLIVADFESALPADQLMFAVGACLGFLAALSDDRKARGTMNQP